MASQPAAATMHGMNRIFIVASVLEPHAAGRAVESAPATPDLALRGVRAYDARSALVVLDRPGILGATAFVLDEAGLMRLANDFERALPLP
jgi:hypothetical protein